MCGMWHRQDHESTLPGMPPVEDGTEAEGGGIGHSPNIMTTHQDLLDAARCPDVTRFTAVVTSFYVLAWRRGWLRQTGPQPVAPWRKEAA